MKAWVGFLGLFGLGAGVGFFAGVHFEQRRKRKEEEDILRQEQEESEKIMKEQGYDSNEDDSEPSEMDMEKTAREMEEYLAKFEHPDDEEDLEDDTTEVHEAGKAGTDDIELFFDEDRWDSETEYACRELYYYVEDGVVADEDEHRIEDYEDMIGPEAINELLEAGTGVIFARNSWTEELFKVTQMNNAYARLVLGLEENE